MSNGKVHVINILIKMKPEQIKIAVQRNLIYVGCVFQNSNMIAATSASDCASATILLILKYLF